MLWRASVLTVTQKEGRNIVTMNGVTDIQLSGVHCTIMGAKKMLQKT